MNKMMNTNQKIEGIEGITVGDYWAWAYSDILMNTNRAVFAEFLVGTAIDAIDSHRVEWDKVDIYYKNKGIEVKCSAYLQSWNQKELSHISYDIGKKKADNVSEDYPNEPNHASECYVFCLYTKKDKERANVLELASWKFYVLPTSYIDKMFGEQQSIALSVLEKHCNPVSYWDMKNQIDTILDI